MIVYFPRTRRTTDDGEREERKRLLMVVNAQSIRAGPQVWIRRFPIGVLHQRVEGKDGCGLIPLATVRRSIRRPGREAR
jgi:hypothetical protein